MIDVTQLRIFVCTTPTNMTASFDTLMGRAREIFDHDPTSGHLFLFFNRRRDRVKVLFWDHDGFCIYYKSRAGRDGRLVHEASSAPSNFGLLLSGSFTDAANGLAFVRAALSPAVGNDSDERLLSPAVSCRQNDQGSAPAECSHMGIARGG